MCVQISPHLVSPSSKEHAFKTNHKSQHFSSPEYLLLYLRSQLGREAIAKGTVGAVQQKLPIKNIQAIPIPLLSEKDKNALFCTLDSIFAGISNNVIQSAKLASLRDTLLPRLMSSELDVSDIDL